MSDALAEVVGVRFSPRGPLTWFLAGKVAAEVRSWVVAERDGAEAVGQVIVGRGQCVGYPADPGGLPRLLRAARPEEVPPSPAGAGKALLESLP